MRSVKKFLIAASTGFIAFFIAATATASPTNPVNGVDYRTLEQPQPTEAGGNKVEVIEFFWYACPHCNALEPALNDWVKKQGDNILFKRVPVNFRESFVPQQRLYYTLEEMGKLDEMHAKVFQAIHNGRQTLDTDASVIEFIEKQGIDKKEFVKRYNSFSVSAKVTRAKYLQGAYNVDGVPMIAIGGRYLTAPSIVGAKMGRQSEKVLEDATLQVMSALVARVAKEKNAAPAASKPAAAETKPAAKTAEPAAKKPAGKTAEPAQKK